MNGSVTFWCPFCGMTVCGGECVIPHGPYEGKEMGIRATGDVKVAKLAEEAFPEKEALGHAASKEELQAYLEGYLGDDVFAQRFADCISMLRVKNADYSQGEQKGDRIAAFKRIARDVNIPMTKVWAVFAQKHWGAIMRFCKDGRLESEPINGRIDDLINYLVLLGAIIEDLSKEGK